VIPHPGNLAPGLRPHLIDRLPGGVDQVQPVAQGRRPPELEAEQRRQQQRSTVPSQAVVQLAIVDFGRDLVPTVG